MSKIPFQSQLIPHFEVIKYLRKCRKTWREVAELLRPYGIQTSGSAVFQFYKRHSKRPAPLGFMEDEAKPKISKKPESIMEKIKRAKASAQVEKKEPVFRFDAEEIRKAQ